MRGASIETRIMAKISVEPGIAPMGCWNWEGLKSPKGYARFKIGKQPIHVHRAVYETFREPIPKGLHIDHLCRNRGCVNPWHLEAVTPKQNTLRGWTVTGFNARKTHCHRGHPLNGDNLCVDKLAVGRYCRICRKINNSNSAARARVRRIQ